MPRKIIQQPLFDTVADAPAFDPEAPPVVFTGAKIPDVAALIPVYGSNRMLGHRDGYGNKLVRDYGKELLAEVRRLRALNESVTAKAASSAEVLARLSNVERLRCPKCSNEWEA